MTSVMMRTRVSGCTPAEKEDSVDSRRCRKPRTDEKAMPPTMSMLKVCDQKWTSSSSGVKASASWSPLVMGSVDAWRSKTMLAKDMTSL